MIRQQWDKSTLNCLVEKLLFIFPPKHTSLNIELGMLESVAHITVIAGTYDPQR